MNRYTNKGIFGRILAMLEFFKIWRLVNKIYQLQFESAWQQVSIIARDDPKGEMYHAFKKTMKIRVAREQIINEVSLFPLFKGKKGKPIGTKKSLTTKVHKTQDLINCAIGYGYVKQDKVPNFVYLTDKGAKFRSFSWLLVEFVEHFGKLWSFSLGIIGGLITWGLGGKIIFAVHFIIGKLP